MPDGQTPNMMTRLNANTGWPVAVFGTANGGPCAGVVSSGAGVGVGVGVTSWSSLEDFFFH